MAANHVPVIKYTKLFINNEFVNSVSGKTFPTTDPATEKVIAHVAEGDKEDIDLAVKAAKTAFAHGSEWRKLDASARGDLLLKLAALIERDIQELAAVEAIDSGKHLSLTIHEIKGAISSLKYHAGLCDKIQGNTIPADGGLFALTRKEPVGVVGQIIPWNAPFLMVIWKWSMALAAGCTIVLKPAEQTPLTALMAAALTKEAGFPKGVINVVTGFGPSAGGAIVAHSDVNKVAFTGSTEVGHKIMEEAGKSNLKRVSLELGGKSPLVIFEDANLDEAVALAHHAVFANQGQVCVAASRTFVQAGIYDAFVKKSIELAKNRKVGDQFTAGVQQCSQIDKVQFDKILHLINIGIKEGAKLEIGGQRIGNKGFFIQPTVFSNVSDEMVIAHEEIFGPVQCIFKFNTMEEVIKRANDTPYGLGAGVLTKDLDKALIFAQAIEAGVVWVNGYLNFAPQIPFGGYKQSGLGREMGTDGIENYLETKSIVIKLSS